MRKDIFRAARIVKRDMRKTWVALLLFILGFSRMAAQDVIVTVTPVQEVLPPQVLLYISDPGKYFNVTLTNTSNQQQDIYLAMQIQQTMPASGLSVATPPKRQSPKPISIPANGTRQLTMVEIKTLFNHVPSQEVSATPGLFESYYNGSFGLLPEGQYEAKLTAYRWASPQLATPYAVSNPTSGVAHFTVCYKAQAPQFLSPVSTNLSLENTEVAELDALMPMFTWTQPVVACNPAVMGFKYSFKVVEVLKGQNPDDAIERNPVVYRADNLMAAQCIIPKTVVNSQFYTDRTYAAQVTAVSTSTNVLNYVMLENGGKSTYRLFKMKTGDMEPEQGDDKGNQEPAKDDDKDGYVTWGEDELSGLISTDSLYSFSYPTILKPQFPEEGGARKMFMGNSLKVEWIASSFRGGEGSDPKSIEIQYDVEVFSGQQVCDLEPARRNSRNTKVFSYLCKLDAKTCNYARLQGCRSHFPARPQKIHLFP